MAVEKQRVTPGRITNDTIETQLNHRTIRAFTEEAVGEGVIETLLDVARHGASNTFYQQFTILRIKDPEIRQVVYEASRQEYVGGSRGELFIFVVDLARNVRIRQQVGLGVQEFLKTTMFMQGMEDTMIAAQNMVVAAESLGLGTCFLGSIGGDPRALIKALRLPKFTYPLVGLLVGHPNQEPQLKPRLPREVTTAVDVYPNPDSPSYQASMKRYDSEIQTYYDLRENGKRLDTFTQQISTKPGRGHAESFPALEVLQEQGMCLG